MEGQESPSQIDDIDDHEIPQDPSLIAPEVPADSDGPTKILTPEKEVPSRSTRVRTQTDTNAPSMIGKRYEYIMTQLWIQGVLNPDAHIFAQEDFYQDEPKVVIAIMGIKCAFRSQE